jgi:F0F1-type ATP synthase assembly protein I
MENGSDRRPGLAVRIVSRLASTMPVGLAVALLLALGLGVALVQPLRAGATAAGAAQG